MSNPARQEPMFVHGKMLLVLPDATLPRRCVSCNVSCEDAPQQHYPVPRSNDSGLLVGALVGGAIGGAIGRALDAKSAGLPADGIRLYVSICPAHRNAGRASVMQPLAIGCVTIIAAILVGVLYMGIMAAPVIAVGMIVAAARGKYISEKHKVAELFAAGTHGDYVVVIGAGEPFLKSLPPYPEGGS